MVRDGAPGRTPQPFVAAMRIEFPCKTAYTPETRPAQQRTQPMSAPIVVTAATHTELSLMLKTCAGRTVDTAGGIPVWEGETGSGRIILAVTGMGKINAAAAAAALVERHAPALLVNTGCAGAFPESGLAVGDLAVASVEVCADEGVLDPSGWLSYEDIGIPAVERKGIRYYNEFPLSLAVAERAVLLAASLGIPIMRGKFLTVSTCSGTAARGRELYHRFGALCENMEGAAVAQVALRYGVDCLEVRGISNLVEDRDPSRWDIPLAVERSQRFILKLITAWRGE
jgi:futalosine hydrolase